MKISKQAQNYVSSIIWKKRIEFAENRKTKLIKIENQANSIEKSSQILDYLLNEIKDLIKTTIDSYASAYQKEHKLIDIEDMREIYLEIKKLINTEEFTISELRILDPFYYNSTLKKQIEIKARMFAESDLSFVVNEMEMNKMIEQNKDKHYEILRWIFDKVNGQQYKPTYLRELINDNLDFTENDLEKISDYLSGEGLIKQMDDSGLLVQLTHKGIVEIQDSINNPQRSTEHFPAQVIQYFNAPVGSVQTGNQNVANVQQNFGAKTEDVINLLRELRGHISDDKKQEGLALIESLEKEVKSEKPNEPTIKLFLQGIGNFVKDTGQDLLVEIGKKLISGEIQFPS